MRREIKKENERVVRKIQRIKKERQEREKKIKRRLVHVATNKFIQNNQHFFLK